MTKARKAALMMLIILGLLWLVQIVNVAVHYQLDLEFAIRPHIVADLPDILTAPFLHASWAHIQSNSVPLVILGFLAAYPSLAKFAGVTAIVLLTSGLLVWLTGTTGSYVVGASGVIFGWFGYVLVRGFFDHRLSDIAIGVAVTVYYIWVFALLLPSPGISYQDHIGGLIGGVLCGWIFRDRKRVSVTADPLLNKA